MLVVMFVSKEFFLNLWKATDHQMKIKNIIKNIFK
jgi:hypothetical protein